MEEPGFEEHAKLRAEDEERARAEEERIRDARQDARENDEVAEKRNQRLLHSCHRGWFLATFDAFSGSVIMSTQIVILFLFIPVAFNLIRGGALTHLAPGGSNAIRGRHLQHQYLPWVPALTGAAFVLFVALLVLQLTIKRQMAATWARESAWLAALPFPLTGYVESVGGRSHDLRLVLRVTFDEPAEGRLHEARALIKRVDPEGRAKRDKQDKHVLMLSARVPCESREDVDWTRAARVLFHELVEGVIVQLGEQSKVTRVEIRTEEMRTWAPTELMD